MSTGQARPPQLSSIQCAACSFLSATVCHILEFNIGVDPLRRILLQSALRKWLEILL